MYSYDTSTSAGPITIEGFRALIRQLENAPKVSAPRKEFISVEEYEARRQRAMHRKATEE